MKFYCLLILLLSFSFSFSFAEDFNAEDSKTYQEKAPYSEKAAYLFQTILKNTITLKHINRSNQTTTYRKISTIKKHTEFALREFLKEVNIPNLKKQTLQRILNNFYNESSERIIQDFLRIIKESNFKPKNNDPIIDFLKRKKIVYQTLDRFVRYIEDRYVVQDITSSERKAIELFRQLSFLDKNLEKTFEMEWKHLELLKKRNEKQKLTNEEKRELKFFDKQAREDIRIFRKILHQLGLPREALHDITLRSYIGGLKTDLLEAAKIRNAKILIRDANILETIRNIKLHLDTKHYENLKTMSNPLGAKFLKSLPSQFLTFQAAMGAFVYIESLTDPYFYGAEKNPEMLAETLKHSLSLSGVLSFYIFFAVNQQANYLLYGLGRRVDGKFRLNGKGFRSTAPGASLGLAYFASVLFTDLYNDRELHQCVKQHFISIPNRLFAVKKKEEKEDSPNIPYIDSCEYSYLKWVNWTTWIIYGMDGITFLGAGLLSHRSLRYASRAFRLQTLWHLFLRGSRIGARVVPYGQFIVGFVDLLALLGFYKLLTPLAEGAKEKLTSAEINGDLIHLTNKLTNKLNKGSVSLAS